LKYPPSLSLVFPNEKKGRHHHSSGSRGEGEVRSFILTSFVKGEGKKKGSDATKEKGRWGWGGQM